MLIKPIFGGLLLVLVVMAGCDSGGNLAERIPTGLSEAPTVFSDDVQSNTPALNVRQELLGVDADGQSAVVRVSWALTSAGSQAVRSNSRVRLRVLRDGEPAEVIETQPVSEEEPVGEIDVPVNTETDQATRWYLELDRADLQAVPSLTTYTVVSLDTLLQRKTTPLEDLQRVELSLVKDSYIASNVGNRREHKFSVSVQGDLAVPAESGEDGSLKTIPVHVTGLLDDGQLPFSVYESGVLDTESPLSATDVRKDPLVYLIMDASSSMLNSECADDLYHAVSTTVVTLSPAATFKYRIFDNEVYEVSSTLEFAPIASDASGSALYYALDTVVSDIEQWVDIDRDVFIIAYSDGLDLASWNHYNFASRDAVVTHVGRRLSNLAQQHSQQNGRLLKTFLVGFDPRTGSEAEEMLYLATQGGGQYVQMSREDCDASFALQNSGTDTVQDKINETFLSLTDHIRSVYHISYSSQQTHGKSSLSLELMLNETLKHSINLPARPVE
jgi:hypothetical protein